MGTECPLGFSSFLSSPSSENWKVNALLHTISVYLSHSIVFVFVFCWATMWGTEEDSRSTGILLLPQWTSRQSMLEKQCKEASTISVSFQALCSPSLSPVLSLICIYNHHLWFPFSLPDIWRPCSVHNLIRTLWICARIKTNALPKA